MFQNNSIGLNLNASRFRLICSGSIFLLTTVNRSNASAKYAKQMVKHECIDTQPKLGEFFELFFFFNYAINYGYCFCSSATRRCTFAWSSCTVTMSPASPLPSHLAAAATVGGKEAHSLLAFQIEPSDKMAQPSLDLVCAACQIVPLVFQF